MLLKCFSVWDDKAKAFMAPFFYPEPGQAIRAFADCVNDPKHGFGKNPHDYSLFVIGTFDDGSGMFRVDTVEALCNGPGVLRRGV